MSGTHLVLLDTVYVSLTLRSKPGTMAVFCAMYLSVCFPRSVVLVVILTNP